MGDFRVELFTGRERRAALVALVAVLLVAAAAVHELAPARAAHRGAPIAPAAQPVPLSVFGYAAESASAVTVAAGKDFATAQLYRTADSGRSWHGVKLPAGADHVGAISLVPGTTDLLLWAGPTGFAGGRGTGGRAWRSHDHGAHWAEVAMPDPNASGGPRFLDSAHGYWTVGFLGGFHVYATADGGRQWQDAFDLPAITRDLDGVPIPAGRQVAFTASTPAVGWLVVTARSSEAGGAGIPVGVPQVFRSSDGWRTWQPASLALPAAPDGYFLSVPPPQVGVDGRGFVLVLTGRPSGRPAAGGFTATLGGGAVVATTTDGGVSWSPPAPSEHLGLQLVGGSLLVSVDGSSMAVSRDLGTSWTVMTPELPAGRALTQLSMLNADVGWSSDGRPGEARGLLRTLDGGRTWSAIPGPTG